MGRPLLFLYIHFSRDKRKAIVDYNLLLRVCRRRSTRHQPDTLTVVCGLTGSCPNFFLEVSAHDVEDFITRFALIRNRDDYEQFVAVYSILRANPAFWSVSDWFYDKAMEDDPLHAGIFELNR